jgi:hypothetical protein
LKKHRPKKERINKMFCMWCGKKMVEVKTDDSWEEKYLCPCGWNLTIYLGDMGQEDHYRWDFSKKKNKK